jgi:hypothetical protein
MLPVTLVVTSVATTIIPAIVPAAEAMPAVPVMLPVVFRVVFAVVAGRPPRGMPGTALVFQQIVILAAARITRVCVISLDGGNATDYQSCGEQEGLKHCTGFHESDSFLVVS